MAVTSTNNLRQGMKNNDDVRQLQTLLNQNGANLAIDGNFGPATLAAVKTYQKNNNLKVDGIVGTNTWGALTKNSAATAQTNTQSTAPTSAADKYRYDADNDAVLQAAKQKIADTEAAAPVYAGTYDKQMQDMYDRVMNQKEFSYDLNGDALWQQYKDQYTTQGKLAMMDTMGQAAALNGGYGSSYAQNVGQQAYQGYLQQLNDRVPELYQLALDKYNNDYALLKDRFSTTAQMQADEYGKYQDALGQHNIDLDRARSDYDTAYDRGYNSWLTGEQLRRDDENTAYAKQQDAYNNLANLISTSGYSPSQDELAAAGMSATQAAAYAKYYKDQKKKTTTTKTKTTKTATGLTVEQFSDLQSKLDGWAEAGEDRLNAELNYYVSHYGLDAKYAEEIFLQYFPTKEDKSADTTITKDSNGFFNTNNPDDLKNYYLKALK